MPDMPKDPGLANAIALPWVRVRKRPQERCDGIKWSTVALSDLHPRGGKPARGIQERSRCKRRGWYAFTATKKRRKWEDSSLAQSGVYCRTHLFMQLWDYSQERRRAERWWNQNGWWSGKDGWVPGSKELSAKNAEEHKEDTK